MEEVRRAVVAARRGARDVIDLELDLVADAERAARRPCRDARRARRRASACPRRRTRVALRPDLAAVADLAAALRVEGRLVATTTSPLSPRASAIARADRRARARATFDVPRLALVAGERPCRRARSASAWCTRRDRGFADLAASLALARRLELAPRTRRGRPTKPRSLADDLLKVEREAVRVVELERDAPGRSRAPSVSSHVGVRRRAARARARASPEAHLFLRGDVRDERRASRRAPGRRRPSRRRPRARTSCKNGRSMPSRCPCRIARRMTRRSTYSRPSVSGKMPSAIRNAVVRAWSAMTRIETSSGSSVPPYGLSAICAARSTSGREQIGVVVARHALLDAPRAARAPSPVSTHGAGSGDRAAVRRRAARTA